jgi:hypothetical protein
MHREQSSDSAPREPNAKRSGRAVFDERGNSVWEWQTEDTGTFSRDVNTQYVKKLEVPELSLEEGAPAQGQRAEADGKEKLRAGFNPYDRAMSPGESKMANANSAEAQSAKKPIKDLRRYNEWVKLKQRMAQKKDDE